MKGFTCCIMLVAAAAGAVAGPSHPGLIKNNLTRSTVGDYCNICDCYTCVQCGRDDCVSREPCTEPPTPEPCGSCPPVEDCPTYEPPQCPTCATPTCPTVEECPTIPAITCPTIPDCPTNPPRTTLYPGTCPPTQLIPPRFSKSIYQTYLPTWPTAGTTVHLGINATIGGNLPLVYQLVTSFEILALSASHDIIFTNNISEGAYVGPNNVMILEVTATAMWDESITSSAAIALVFPRGTREATHQTNPGVKNI